MKCIPVMRSRVAGTQSNRELILLFRAFPVPTIQIQYEGQRCVSLAEIVVQRQGLVRGLLGLCKGLRRSQDPIFPIARQCIGVGESYVGLGILWVRRARSI